MNYFADGKPHIVTLWPCDVIGALNLPVNTRLPKLKQLSKIQVQCTGNNTKKCKLFAPDFVKIKSFMA